MASDHYSGLSFPVYGSLDSEYPYPSTVDLYTGLYAFEHGIPAEHTATTSPMQRVMPALPIIHSTNPLLSPISECNTSLISAEARGIYLAQCHATYPSYAEKTTQTTNLDTSGECKRDHWEEAHQMCRPPLKHKMAPQELYKATRHLTGFGESDIIEFIVDSEEGICLSNASEDNWVGFKGGDDRSLFEGDRLQIMIRLHFVGCSPWHSKIPTTDFTAKRRPITRKKLAAEVAKSMKKFIAREKVNGHDGSHPRCGWGDMSIKNVFLTRMVRVSAASWQPEIFVEWPSAP